MTKTLYDFTFNDLSGKDFSLAQFKGRPVIIVNTASLCGFSQQFPALEQIWQQRKAQGLTVIGVPSNDFGRQEPGNSQSIVTACSAKFGVSFPLTEKAKLTGANMHPLFRWLAAETGFFGKPRWNFYKYLIGRDGQVKDWFSPLTSPSTAKFKHAVETITAA